jgi:RHS repeat-associated protein
LTDASGTVQTEYSYEPFGAVTASGSSSSNELRYTGREDDGTSLYYYRARYYHPGLQRFISEDPLEFAAGDVNLYAYVQNSPILHADPLGLYTVEYTYGPPQCITLTGRKPGREEDCSSDPLPVMYACWICRWSVKLNVPPPPRSAPLPRGWNPDWNWDFSRHMGPQKGPRWIDPKGGEHRWHRSDKWHPRDHWDYNPRNAPNSPWDHYDLRPPFWWIPGQGGPPLKVDS